MQTEALYSPWGQALAYPADLCSCRHAFGASAPACPEQHLSVPPGIAGFA